MLVVLTAPEDVWNVKNKEGLTAEEVATSEDVKDELHSLKHVPKKKHGEQGEGEETD